VLNVNTNRGSAGPHAMLLFNIVQQLRHNPQHAREFLDLYSGGYSPKCSAPVVDGVTIIDTFETQNIIEHNNFGCPDLRSSDDSIFGKPSREGPFSSAGVWTRASFINHACDGNARYAFIGDLMLIHASKDIAKGDEILMPYHIADSDPRLTVKALQDWGFKCDCPLCVADGKTPFDQIHKRVTLSKEASAFVDDNKKYLHTHIGVSQALINKAESLYAEIEATYDKQLYDGLPRRALEDLGTWLFAALNDPYTQREGIEAALKHLRNNGFKIAIKGKSVNIDPHTGYVMPTVVDAGLFAAHIYEHLGQKKLSKQFKSFAKRTFRILYGESGFFDQTHGCVEG